MKRRGRSRAERATMTAIILSGNATIKNIADLMGIHPVTARTMVLNTIVQAHKTNGVKLTGVRGLRKIYGTDNIAGLKKKAGEVIPIVFKYGGFDAIWM